MVNCCGQWKTVVAMIGINLALAMVNVLLKLTLDKGVHNLVLVTYRQSIACGLLTPIAFFWERKNRPELTARIICHLFFSALIGITFTQYFFLLGLQYTSATYASAFSNMVPVYTFLLALPFGLEKVSIRSKGGIAKILGSLICIGGALSLTLYKGMPLTNQHSHATAQIENHDYMMSTAKRRERWVLGSVFAAAGCFMWASWFLIQAKIGKSYPFQYSSTAILSFFGAIQSVILTLLTERSINMSMWVLKGKLEILSVTYSGAVGSGLCYVGMSWCVKQKGPLFTSAFTPLIQIFVAMIDFSALHELIYLGSVVGSVLVIVGMYVLLWGKSNDDAKEIGMKQTQANEEGADVH
ncbi:PREDICTED: WAT1-related protein At3g30340-like isoform X2 [Fragaria vesca subsp. vesca]|uniref:WAT1-related protein At3g30340-like isoform X2 n=1 Tax=Fragaria vesca subsp. vesca TaxID=101020 RepID=UPI0002C31C9E|nr:PREDICTED: WAT1-related protein At3g30340-like isoform X2 [Fragaria vesca subsp. vesca]